MGIPSYVPIELLKTVILIADLGSVTRAARELGISQSAVSSQMRRLESLLSSAVFVKQGRGVQLTETGLMVTSHARRIVALSDRLLTIVDAGESRMRRARVGLPSGLDSELLLPVVESLATALGEGVALNCDSRGNLLHALESGFIDVAMMMDIAPIPAQVGAEWIEQWQWVKATDFLLSPGAPIPLVSWPDCLSDRLCTAELQRAGVAFSVAFTSPNRCLRRAAVAAGIGVMAASERSIRVANLRAAREYYLPPLAPVRGGIYLAEGVDQGRAKRIVDALQGVLQP
ncbi:MAG: LysR family transcriptional regulator [Hyphomicrobiales bacterium]|nr:LysR family transcriptional regulator [Hyphomicrobiales bacterium]